MKAALGLRKVVSAILIMWLLVYEANCQNYPLLYENNFEDDVKFTEFEFSDNDAWTISDSANNHALELFRNSRYILPVSSPFNIAVLKAVRVGSFVLEVDVKQTSIEYSHRDLCIFFGMKDPTNYYYVHISSIADPYAHSIFLVNDEPQANITSKVSKGVDWGNEWHKVRVERDAAVGIINVFFDDMSAPIMQAHDLHFREGFVGFGSFDDTGMFDNIKLWGEKTEDIIGFFD